MGDDSSTLSERVNQRVKAVAAAEAHVTANLQSLQALTMLNDALVALGELLWRAGEPDAISHFHCAIALNTSRVSVASDDVGGHVALVKCLALVAEWNAGQRDVLWALEFLKRARASSKKVGQLRSMGHALPVDAGASLHALHRALEAFAALVETEPLRPEISEQVKAFFRGSASTRFNRLNAAGIDTAATESQFPE